MIQFQVVEKDASWYMFAPDRYVLNIWYVYMCSVKKARKDSDMLHALRDYVYIYIYIYIVVPLKNARVQNSDLLLSL